MKKPLRILIVLLLCVIATAGQAQSRQPTGLSSDAMMREMGFIDVCFWEPSIQCYLVYATPDNFVGKTLYPSTLTKAWLHHRAARMLIRAQDILKKERPDLSLLIYDAARPMEVQRVMWEWAKRTRNEYYVADPAKGGGLHNYGIAVDVTLVNDRGEWLSMGTPFDYFGPESHTDKEDDLLQRRRITPAEYANRKLLRRIMEEAGFKSIASEWWHFNACPREEAIRRYKRIE
jgi:D-alanyl-D-alanine dipeptidase